MSMDYEREFSKLLKSIHNHRSYEVFKDFVIMSAISISNKRVHFDEKLEQEYLKIVKKYTKEQAETLSKMLGVTTLALSNQNHHDFLGKVYMKLELGNKDQGQCFTPFKVCQLLARMDINENNSCTESVNDCCCGAGALIIAAHEIKKNIIAVAQDIDYLCVCMSYVQLSLLNIKAVVYHSNTLTMDFWSAFYTPALVHHYAQQEELKNRMKLLNGSNLGVEA